MSMIMIISALYQTNRLRWIFTEMSLHVELYPDSEVTSLCSFSLISCV